MTNSLQPPSVVGMDALSGNMTMQENYRRAAIMADFVVFHTPFNDAVGYRGGQMLTDTMDAKKTVTFRGSNNIPLKIGTNGWYFCDTDVAVTIPADLDDYLEDEVLEDGTGTWTASDNVTASTDAGQVKLAVADGFTTGLVAYRDISAVDLSVTGKNSVSLLITSSVILRHGDLQILVDEHSGCVSASEILNVPALKAGVQTRVILSLASASGDRNAVISIGLNATRDFGAANVWIDDIKTTSIEAGKDYHIYACDNSGALIFKASKASTYPAGYTALTARKIGGFHTLAGAVGTISGHTLTGYDTADVNPYSVWDLRHRPRCNPAGMAYSPKTGKWVDIYLVSGNGSSSLSVNGGTISDTRTWLDFVDDVGAVGKRLLTDSEFQCMASGSNEETNILGSVDPVTTGPHVDTAGRRMISNIGLEDCCGVVWQWLQDQSYRWASDGTMAAASKTVTITHAASPGGNPIYVKYGAEGRPYLACNMATDAVDKFLTFGGAVTILVKHDAAAATGGYQVYFDEDGTQPSRLLCALPGLKTEYLDTSDPNYPLKLTYAAAPATPGVAVTYDDGADERLEFTSPTAANGTLDLASYGLTWGYSDLPGAKGSLYRQSSYGDVKLLAGGYWSNGASCGSRSRSANDDRAVSYSSRGARFASEPL